MKAEQIVFSLRLSENINKYVKEKAAKLGISQNSLMLILMDLGRELYESKKSFNFSKE